MTTRTSCRREITEQLDLDLQRHEKKADGREGRQAMSEKQKLFGARYGIGKDKVVDAMEAIPCPECGRPLRGDHEARCGLAWRRQIADLLRRSILRERYGILHLDPDPDPLIAPSRSLCGITLRPNRMGPLLTMFCGRVTCKRCLKIMGVL